MIMNFVSDTEKFTLDGVSSDTLGLFCDFLPPVPAAEQLYTTYNTGADEMGTTADDVFNDITYPIRFYTFLADNYNDIAIKNYCTGKSILTLSHCPDYYFKIRRMKLTALDNTGYGKRIDYILTLTLAPFRYVVDNEWVDVEMQLAQTTIYNLHTKYSKPLIEVTGTGAVSIVCQGQEFRINGLTSNQTVVVDSEHKRTYSGTEFLTGMTEGEYPLFNVGENHLQFSQSITSARYKCNWRDY